MKHHMGSMCDRTPTSREPRRVAVVGGGIAGLTCARELSARGHDAVVFEASDRLGGRCSSLSTRVGLFDDGAQCISGATGLAVHAVQRPGQLAVLHPWTVPARPAEEDRHASKWGPDEDEEDIHRTLKLTGTVGVPSMVALADALARPLDVRVRTPIVQARRQGPGWVLSSSAGEIKEEFRALVLAIPAPLALPLLVESSELTAALSRVRYRSRWVLLLGSERPVSLPGYREFEGSPIERIAGMHSKPGRSAVGPQRWFVEADQRWSLQHEHEDAETVAHLLLDNFREHAGRSVMPNYLCAYLWRHAFVETSAAMPTKAACLWDAQVNLGVCGDSVVASRVDQVHRSGVDMAHVVAASLGRMGGRSGPMALGSDLGELLEAQL